MRKCLPCEQKLIFEGLIKLCKKSSVIQSEIDCLELSDQVINGDITINDAINMIKEASKDSNDYNKVKKIISTVTG